MVVEVVQLDGISVKDKIADCFIKKFTVMGMDYIDAFELAHEIVNDAYNLGEQFNSVQVIENHIMLTAMSFNVDLREAQQRINNALVINN